MQIVTPSITITLDVLFLPWLLCALCVYLIVRRLMLDMPKPVEDDLPQLPPIKYTTYRTPYMARVEDDMTWVEGIDHV